MGKLGVDFPLADFLTDNPDKSFLSGVTSGQRGQCGDQSMVCRAVTCCSPSHRESNSSFGLEKNDRALPRRLVVTYRAEPGQPSLIAELSDWNFSAHPSDAEFTFKPPEGASGRR